MKLDLHRLAITIFQFCAKHCIRLEVQWIPRTENEKTDYISRLIDFDDWQITPPFFRSLEDLWGPHTVDCFANFYTAKLHNSFHVSGTRVHQETIFSRRIWSLKIA